MLQYFVMSKVLFALFSKVKIYGDERISTGILNLGKRAVARHHNKSFKFRNKRQR